MSLFICTTQWPFWTKGNFVCWTFPYLPFNTPWTWGDISIQAACRTDSTIQRLDFAGVKVSMCGLQTAASVVYLGGISSIYPSKKTKKAACNPMTKTVNEKQNTLAINPCCFCLANTCQKNKIIIKPNDASSQEQG